MIIIEIIVIKKVIIIKLIIIIIVTITRIKIETFLYNQWMMTVTARTKISTTKLSKIIIIFEFFLQ